jgi:hypothetical protein
MSPLFLMACVAIGHPGQVRRWRTRAGIQKEFDYIILSLDSPFDFAQDRESFDFAQDRESFDFAQDREPVERPVEPRISPREAALVLNDALDRL